MTPSPARHAPDDRKTKKRNPVHWLAPTTMLLALLCGVLFAVGHHLFYASKNLSTVPTGSYTIAGRKLSQQQFNTAVGTAFSFLVRTAVVVAISTAYVQLFWRSVANQQSTLADLDWGMTGTANFLNLFDFRRTWKYPLLASLALIYWIVPIATIFPPATLSVISLVQMNHHLLAVAQLDFTTFNYMSGLSWDKAVVVEDNINGQSTEWFWQGPSQKVQNAALAVMSLGQTLPIAAPAAAPNASWILEFWGPALQCYDMAPAERDVIFTSIWNSWSAYSSGMTIYLSWVPWPADDHNGATLGGNVIVNNTLWNPHQQAPFICNAKNGSQGLCVGPSAATTVSFGGPASLFVAAMPALQDTQLIPSTGSNTSQITNAQFTCAFQFLDSISERLTCQSWDPEGTSRTVVPATLFEDATLVRCDLLNTSYRADFDYLETTQNIHVTRNTTGHSPVINASEWFNSRTVPQQLNSSASREACDSFTVNANDSDQQADLCEFDGQAVRLTAYQGVMAAFNQLIVGSMKQYMADDSAVTRVNSTTSVLETILGQTEELSFLQRPDDLEESFLQSFILQMPGWVYSGLSDANSTNISGNLTSTLETLFQNFTISLIGEPYFQPNYSSPFAPPRLTNVSVRSLQNIYTYDPMTLWIAYGLAILFTTLAVGAGLLTMYFFNHAAFSNSFTSILRVSRASGLSTEVHDEDGDGRDPLPKYLKKARIDLRARKDLGDVEVTEAQAKSSAVDGLSSVAEEQRLLNDGSNKGGPVRSTTVRTV